MAAKVLVARKLEASSDDVWSAVQGFGRLDVWFPGIDGCEVSGAGVGASRRLTLEGGGEIIDELVSVDPDRRRLAYRRISHPFPVSSYLGTVEVFTSYDGFAVVAWTVDFEAEAEHVLPVKEMLTAGIGAGVAGMGDDLSGRD